ncbi:MAG: large conductance mechanosensitive channel protein MscL [Clostridia bacterium]
MWKQFKEFAFKGNVIDMAVGVMIGGAFSKIVTSLVNDVFMPAIGIITGPLSFEQYFIALDGNTYASLAEAKAAGAACITYGAFLSNIIDFFLMAICVFMFVKLINKLRTVKTKEQEKPIADEKRICPFCMSEVNEKATRCPYCTSVLGEIDEQEQ